LKLQSYQSFNFAPSTITPSPIWTTNLGRRLSRPNNSTSSLISMAACCQPQPAVDYFNLTALQRPQNTTFSTSPHLWEPTPFSLPSPDSCDTDESTLPSPTTVVHPNLYGLPRDSFDHEIKEDTPFDLGSFDDWIGWDDPADNALSPTSTLFFPELKMEASSPNMQSIEPLPAARPQYQMQNGVEESGAVFGDAQMDQPLFQTAEQPRESLYSTPLSWSPPISNVRNSEAYSLAPALSPRQKSELIAQAMPSTRKYPSSPSSASSPEPEQCNGRKRKSTSGASDDGEDYHSPPPSSGARLHPPVKKTAHNMIEKRYRTNLNDKIAALRDSVPSLRIMTKTNSRGEEVVEDLQGLTPAHKLNKATILSKATEYIAHLERRNKILNKDNSALNSRVEAFEILMMAREPEQAQQRQQSQSQPMRNRRTQSRQGSSTRYSLDGMVS